MKPGDCFQVHGQGFHLHIVISSEHPSDGLVLVVNITDAEHCEDSTCFLQIGEHPFITKESAVAYHRANAWPPNKIAENIQNGSLKQHPPLPPAILKRVIDGALDSEELAPKFRKYLPSE